MKRHTSDIGVPDFDEHRQLYSVHMPYGCASQCQQQKAKQKDQLMLVAWGLLPHVLSTTYAFYYRYLS